MVCSERLGLAREIADAIETAAYGTAELCHPDCDEVTRQVLVRTMIEEVYEGLQRGCRSVFETQAKVDEPELFVIAPESVVEYGDGFEICSSYCNHQSCDGIDCHVMDDETSDRLPNGGYPCLDE